MSFFKQLACCFLAGLCMFGVYGCSTEPSSNIPQEIALQPVADQIKPINIENDHNVDKVITEEKFQIPDELTTSASSFKLPALVGSNMVLQANMVTRVWGECTENGFIAVRLTHTETNEVTVYYGEVKDGYFEMYLGKHDYGGPYKLELITESGKKRTLSNIMFGEVYLAGGQSNMGWTVGQCYGKTTSELRYQEEINNATNPKIRYCSLYPTCGDETKDEVYANETSTNGWAESSPSLVVNISALAFFFATELNRMYDDMPVGIIISCMGGTGIHTWMPADAFEKSHKLPCHDDPNQAGNAAVQGSKYYNKMIHPLRKYVPRGVIWCQGEGQWEYYAENFKILIESWREVFDQPDMYVITASHPRSVNVDDFYRARAEHKKACEMMENATYTNVIDCGLLPKNTAAGDEMNADGTGIHPYDKKPVGERMCYAAMEKFYGAVGTWSGPRYKQMWRNGDEIDKEQTAPVRSDILIVTGIEAACNILANMVANSYWDTERGNFKDSFKLARDVFNLGYNCDLVGNYEIYNGNIYINDRGYVQYGNQEYKFIIFHALQFSKKILEEFVKKLNNRKQGASL